MNELIEWFRELFPELESKIYGIGRTAILTISNGSFEGLSVGLNTPIKERPGYYSTTCNNVEEAKKVIVLYASNRVEAA